LAADDVVVAFIDHHRARLVDQHDALEVVVEIVRGAAAEPARDDVERREVCLDRRPPRDRGATRYYDRAEWRRVRSVSCLVGLYLGFPLVLRECKTRLKQRAEERRSHQQQRANPHVMPDYTAAGKFTRRRATLILVC
jgi:hypothetical protein